jgi:hypothetical protein
LKATTLKYFFLSIIYQIYAQELLPFVENYNKQIIRATIKHGMWLKVAMTRYFANNHYLLRYDGVNGKKHVA